jgi:hypothetical protein
MTTSTPPAWDTLAQALHDRRPVRARYHGHQRILCPHALGWHNGRAKLFAYQTGGTTSHGPLPTDPHQRWRTMFVDEIDDAAITDGTWQTADNYRPDLNDIDHIEIAVAH